MNANELADELKEISLIADNHTKIVLDIAETMLRQQQAEIEALNQRIERMIENASHHEAMAHAGGFDAGVESVTMLRQQQAEIGFYKQDVDKYKQKVASQQAEIEALKKEKWLTEIDAKQQALKQVIDMLVLHHDGLACTSYPISKEN
jgi:hypothetical protein